MFTFNKQSGWSSAAVLDSLAEEQISSRLQSAVALARGDLAQNIDEFREILTELIDRADAWQLTRLMTVGQACRRAS